MEVFREHCLSGKRSVGTFGAVPHPVAVEVAAGAGLDFICLDWEHSQFSRDRLEDLLRAAAVQHCPALIRVPGHAPEEIAAALDAGAAGVLVPRVATAAQARALVQATRYPPVGQRGVGPGRAAAYGYQIADCMAQAGGVLLAVQVETAEGLANIEAIAAVEGIDLIFVGPGDLAVSLGALGPAGVDVLEAAIHTILAAARKAGKVAGLFRPDASDLARWQAAGASLFIVGSDAIWMGNALRGMLAQAQEVAV